MERALKERIIGAIVLVALVVLVVPVFLDGPPDSGEIISERVPLPGQSDQETQTVVLERTRDEPMPSQQNATPASSVAEPVAAVADPEPARSTEKDPEPQPAEPENADRAASVPSDSSAPAAPVAAGSATGMYAVQLGSFSSQENAERLAAELRKQGFAAFLSQLATAGGQLHRVRVGPQKDRESAEAMAERLAKAGYKGKVLPHP